MRMRCAPGKGRGGVVQSLPEANPAHSTLATDLDVLLLSIQRKEEKETKFWGEWWGITLSMIIARLLECLKCTPFCFVSPEAENKNQKYGSGSKLSLTC